MTTTDNRTFRVTERNNETDELVRVVAMRTGFRAARAAELESVASDGNHIRLEQWLPNDDDETGAWMYL